MKNLKTLIIILAFAAIGAVLWFTVNVLDLANIPLPSVGGKP